MPILSLCSEIALHTRCENQVENEIDRRPVRYGDQTESTAFQRQYPSGVHRPTDPSRKYNCHGLTFASRRTWIWKSLEIEKILKDDDYEVVELRDVMPGDIVVYSQNGDPEHSGIVVSNYPVPTILSKWGAAHEVVHRVTDCPYNAGQIAYYRIKT
jgi:hypothetical protein